MDPKNRELVYDYLEYMRDRRLSEETIRLYRQTLMSFTEWLGKEPLLEIRARDVRRWIRTLRKRDGSHLEIATIVLKWTAIKSMNRFFLAEEYIDKDHIAREELPKIPKKMAPTISWEEAQKTIKRARTGRELAVCSLIFGCGLRLKEVTQMRLSYISFEESMLRVASEIAKGRKERIVPMPDWVASNLLLFIKEDRALVKSYGQTTQRRALRESKYLFPSPVKQGHPISSRLVQEVFKRSCLRAGIESHRAHCHAGRHAYAVFLLSKKISIRHIQALLGHSSLATTEKYLNLTREDLVEAISIAFN